MFAGFKKLGTHQRFISVTSTSVSYLSYSRTEMWRYWPLMLGALVAFLANHVGARCLRVGVCDDGWTYNNATRTCYKVVGWGLAIRGGKGRLGQGVLNSIELKKRICPFLSPFSAS